MLPGKPLASRHTNRLKLVAENWKRHERGSVEKLISQSEKSSAAAISALSTMMIWKRSDFTTFALSLLLSLRSDHCSVMIIIRVFDSEHVYIWEIWESEERFQGREFIFGSQFFSLLMNFNDSNTLWFALTIESDLECLNLRYKSISKEYRKAQVQ